MTRSAPAAVLGAMLVLVGGGCGGSSPTPPAQPIPPAAPANVQATAGDGAVTVTWDPVPGADGYTVYSAAQAGLTKTSYAALPGGAARAGVTSPCQVAPLTNGTTYWFLVTATRAATPPLESVESAVVSATPVAPVIPGDPHPVTGAAGSISGTGATLTGTFTNPAGYVTSAWFEYGTSAGYGAATPSAAFAQAGPVDHARAVTGLPPLTTIHYRLVTRNDGGTFHGADATFRTMAEPQILLADLDAATDPVGDGAAVFWVEVYGGGGLHRYDLAGGTVASIVPFSPGGNGAWLALDADWVYFGGQAAPLERVRHDGTGHDASFCTTGCATLGAITQLVAHPSGLYVRNGWTDVAPPYRNHQFVTRIGLDGATARELYARDGDTGNGFAGGLAVDATHVYFADHFRGTVLEVPIDGGAPVTLASGLNHPFDFVLDGSDLYVACDAGIERIDVTTGVRSTVYPSPAGYGSLRLSKEGDTIYASGGGLLAVDVATGLATPLAVQPPYSSVAVITPASLYWTTAGDHFDPPLGRLERIAKPQ